MPWGNHQSLRRKPTMSALLKRHISKRSGGEVLSDIKGQKNEQLGKKLPSSANKQSNRAPPLNVSSDIVANAPGTVPGYSNLRGYLPDDVHFDFLGVDEHRYEYGKPLVKDEKSLTMMMRRFHNWYMKTCRESGGMNTLYLRIKEEHDLVGNDLFPVPFEEFFDFFNQKALDNLTVFCYCL